MKNVLAKTCIFTLLFQFLIMISSAEAQDSKYLSNPEVLKIMEESKTLYRIGSTDELTDPSIDDYGKKMFPKLTNHLEFPKVVHGSDSSLYLKSFDFDSIALATLAEGEPFFKIGNYDAAIKYYEKAYELSDSLYVAYLHAGDCHLMNKKFKKALKLYEKAKKINPFDYRPHFYCGTANYRMGNHEHALENYIHAISLKPRHFSILLTLQAKADELGIDVNTETFEPKSYVEKTDSSVNIFIPSENGSIWLAYAAAKAIYLGEDDKRLDLFGIQGIGWNSEMETQAIIGLMDLYLGLVESDKIERIEYLDRLYLITKEGYLDEFIFYEIASKMNPDIVLQLPREIRDSIKEYVKKYVIVKRKG